MNRNDTDMKMPDTPGSMSLGDHLEELRSRVIRCIVAVGVLFAAAWIFREQIMLVLFRPHLYTASGARIAPSLKFRDYLEPVTVQLKACLTASIIVAAPYLLYQAWAFVAPGLYRKERLFFVRILAVSILCFAAGAVFGYFLFIPLALRFLLSLAPASTEPVLMMGAYLSLLLMMTIALGIVFQTPVVIYYLVKWNIVSAPAIRSNRRNAILGAFIIAAFFTPPDPATQIMMAVPVILLYELGLLIAAPSRKEFAAFLRPAGIIALLFAAVLAWQNYVPVARIVDFTGDVGIDAQPLDSGEEIIIKRGSVVTVGEGGRAVLGLGFRGERGTGVMDGGSTASVMTSNRIFLHSGAMLAESGRRGGGIRIELASGEVALRTAEAEVSVVKDDAFKVAVVIGSAEVLYKGNTFTLQEGRMRVFEPDDEEADRDGIRRRWGDLHGHGAGAD